MIYSKIYQHIFWIPEGTVIEDEIRATGWYYWDETDQLGGGPFNNEKLAHAALERYSHSLEEPSKQS